MNKLSQKIRKTMNYYKKTAVVVATLAIGLAAITTNTGVADAATPGETRYQLDSDARYDAKVVADAYGRVTAIWFDLNNVGGWDTLARDVDLNGTIDEVWYDLPEGGYWDAVIYNYPGYDTRWFSNAPTYNGWTVTDRYGLTWRQSGISGLGVISAAAYPQGLAQVMSVLVQATGTVA